MRLAYVSRSDGVHDHRFLRAWEDAGFVVTALPFGEDPDPSKLDKLLREFGPDVVQAGPITSPGCQVAQVWDGPLIVTSWGFDLMDETFRDPARERQARQALARADLVFVDNDAVEERALALGTDPEGVVGFPWGLASEWLDSPAREPHPDLVLLSTRRHESLYRVGDLVDAFVTLAPPFPSVRLVLAGSGTDTAALLSRVADADLNDRVSFVGDLDQHALRTAFLGADLYVSTSSVDGTSISLLEAMASGVPVLVTRIPGNAQWVTDETGRTFEVGDTAGLVARLREWLADPAVRTESGRRAVAARARVLATADWAVTSSRFPEFAERALERHRNRRGGRS